MKTKDIYFYSIGGLFVIGFFVALALVIIRPLPTDNMRIIDMMFGALIASMSTVVNYFYGSSKGSSDKNELLSKANGTT